MDDGRWMPVYLLNHGFAQIFRDVDAYFNVILLDASYLCPSRRDLNIVLAICSDHRIFSSVSKKIKDFLKLLCAFIA
jgi:predicted glycosyltransferase involved in capsule biosynthesis